MNRSRKLIIGLSVGCALALTSAFALMEQYSVVGGVNTNGTETTIGTVAFQPIPGTINKIRFVTGPGTSNVTFRLYDFDGTNLLTRTVTYTWPDGSTNGWTNSAASMLTNIVHGYFKVTVSNAIMSSTVGTNAAQTNATVTILDNH